MKKTNPNFEIKKTSNTLKADRAIHRVTFNPNRASSAEVLKFAEIIAQDNDVYDVYVSSMRTSPWLRMRGRACSEKLSSLLIFERSDAMLKIRRNQELTMRISSIVYQNKYRIPSGNSEGSWILPKSSFWWNSFRPQACTCQQCSNRIWQDAACLWIE